MKKVLILGATGMLGSACRSVLSKVDGLETIPTSRNGGEGFVQFNAAIDEVSDLISATNPDWIINCIGIIKPHIDEKSSASIKRAIEINSLFPEKLSLSTQKPILQIATDCVYSGKKGSYVESDLHDATDVYGKTKSLGETPAINLKHLRVSIIGPEIGRSTSLLEWFRHQPQGAQLNGFTDHLWNGVTTHHFAFLARGIILHDFLDFQRTHIVPADIVEKANLLRIFSAAYGRSDVSIADVISTLKVDRTLSTENLLLNRKLWSLAGYDEPPTVEKMVVEQASYDSK
jgi:dTDP-4-dehydrorhamnose reductase